MPLNDARQTFHMRYGRHFSISDNCLGIQNIKAMFTVLTKLVFASTV